MDLNAPPSLLDRLLDRSVYFSFDASGYRRHAQKFDPADDQIQLEDQVWLVTGANSGIGRATALGLARRSATVVLVCRDEARGSAARAEIQRLSGHPNVQLEIADLSSPGSLRALAERLPHPEINGLVHNAGALSDTRQLTPEGNELTWATHVLGPFLLTKLLSPRLKAGVASRLIFVSSGGMYTQRIDLSDLDWSQRPFDGTVAYAHAKRAQVILTKEWAQRLAPAVSVSAMHPGWVDTPGVEKALPRFYRFTRGRLRTPEQGADTVVWLAAAPRERIPTGRFWFDRRPAPEHLLERTKEHQEDRDRLWRHCEAAVAVNE